MKGTRNSKLIVRAASQFSQFSPLDVRKPIWDVAVLLEETGSFQLDLNQADSIHFILTGSHLSVVK